MELLRIAVATRCFRQPLKTSLRTAAETGATGLQFDARYELTPTSLSETGRRQFLHELKELGLSVASLVLPVQRPFYDQEHLEARIAATRGAMQFAYQLGARVVTARIGRIPNPDSTDYEVLRDVLSDIARFGNHVGATFALTPSGESPETLLPLLQSVTSGPLGVDFDPAGFAMAGRPAPAALRTLYGHVLHVQARDGLRELDGGGIETPVGRGEVEWDELLATVAEIEYRGWITVVRNQGDDRGGDVARAVQFVRRVMTGE